MIFIAKVCPKAINFATAESIHQLLALRPHPSDYASSWEIALTKQKKFIACFPEKLSQTLLMWVSS